MATRGDRERFPRAQVSSLSVSLTRSVQGRASLQSLLGSGGLEEAFRRALGRATGPAKGVPRDSLALLLSAPFRRLAAKGVPTTALRPRSQLLDVPQRFEDLRQEVIFESSGVLSRLPRPLRRAVLGSDRPPLVKRSDSPRFARPLDDSSYFVSSRYGQRGESHHNGVDLAAEEGTPIRAAADGRVVVAGFEPGYGNFMEIEHEDGWRTLYAHTQRNYRKIGEFVKAKDVVACVGSTGRSSGPHLHFEIRDPKDAPQNPASFVFFSSRRTLPE
ncbi:M23 family peptidase domain-containing protein [Chloropicon primus]|nr:hypothetical protein A3770_03p25020 [Chloropicon primus]UPQ99195.1 M23 family peptidase domain-containing protein [Chloropicon primus]|eukprot:QDZ19984.1 hypothetical protein A3770_03p25020 [Chloropicon primus]